MSLRFPVPCHFQVWRGFLPVRLVFIASTSLSIHRVKADLLIILLQGSKILSGLRELALLHALSNIPTNDKLISFHVRFFYKDFTMKMLFEKKEENIFMSELNSSNGYQYC